MSECRGKMRENIFKSNQNIFWLLNFSVEVWTLKIRFSLRQTIFQFLCNGEFGVDRFRRGKTEIPEEFQSTMKNY